MSTRRQILIALGSGTFITPYASFAQQTNKLRRIGFLVAAARPPSIDAHYMGTFIRGLRDLGYVEGKNFVIEWRFADGNYQRLPALAGELVGLNVDVLVTGGTAANSALQKATTTIPIVNATMSDPVGNGFAKSLTHPGGNITGLALATTDMLQALLPTARDARLKAYLERSLKAHDARGNADQGSSPR